MTPESESLWSRFTTEASKHYFWDHDFIDNPYDPRNALDTFVRSAPAFAAARLIGASLSPYDHIAKWANDGLRRLDASLIPHGALLLRTLASASENEFRIAAKQFEASMKRDHRARDLLVDENLLESILSHRLEQGIERAFLLVEWIANHGAPAGLELLLGDFQLTWAARKEGLSPRLQEMLVTYGTTHPSASVNFAALDLLIEGGAKAAAVRCLDALHGNGQLRRAASQPIPALLRFLVASGSLEWLPEILMRQRCAGWKSDAPGIGEFLSEKLRATPREVFFAALCAAERQDPSLLPALLDSLIPGNMPFAWKPLKRALHALGPPALRVIRDRIAATQPGPRADILVSMCYGLLRNPRTLPELLDTADAEFLQGRAIPAFYSYGDVLLAGPSPHAAFQLAWLDRASGAYISATRIDWIRMLGIYDEVLLAELSAPPNTAEPLDAAAHLARVRAAAAPRFIAISDCAICKDLDESEQSFIEVERYLPEAASRLVDHRRCPICGTHYHYKKTIKVAIGGRETRERLTRLTVTEWKASLSVSEYKQRIEFMERQLTHSAARTRHHAARCMAAHSLDRSDARPIALLLDRPDPAILTGALDILWDAAGRHEKHSTLLRLRDRLQTLAAGPDANVAHMAGYILRHL